MSMGAANQQPKCSWQIRLSITKVDVHRTGPVALDGRERGAAVDHLKEQTGKTPAATQWPSNGPHERPCCPNPEDRINDTNVPKEVSRGGVFDADDQSVTGVRQCRLRLPTKLLMSKPWQGR